MHQIEEDLYYLAHSINGRGNTTKTENAVVDSRMEEKLTKIEEKLETINNPVAQLKGALIAIQGNGSTSNNYKGLKY